MQGYVSARQINFGVDKSLQNIVSLSSNVNRPWPRPSLDDVRLAIQNILFAGHLYHVIHI
jgi:hypothetical protein